MTAYFVRRFLLLIPTLLGITLLVFTLTRLVPGGPIERALNAAAMAGGERAGTIQTGMGGNVLSSEQLEQLNAYYGFDKPILVGYADWVGKVLRFDLGTSTRYYEPVWDTIKSRLPISSFYGIVTLILTYLVCIPLGIAKAMRHRSLFDDVSSVIVFIGYALPSYVVAIVLLVVFAFNLEWFPLRGFVSEDYETLSTTGRVLDVMHHATLPLIAYMAGSFAVTTFMMKNMLLDNLSADYVRTAVAKGLTYRTAVFRHALRNSLIPIATSLGNVTSVLVTGSFLIERVFAIEGFGLLGFQSLVQRDYPVVMGVFLLTSLLFLLGNILSDVLVAMVDPRVRFGEGRA